jgi:lipopolysaccharide biosynthesis protein
MTSGRIDNKIPVLIWLYHKDKWNYILSKLVDCKDLAYPVIGLCSDIDYIDIIKSVEENFEDYKIQNFENRGKDILPFLYMISEIDSNYFIKIHSKKSESSYFSDWFQKSIDSLLSRDSLINNIDLISKDKIVNTFGRSIENDVGMIANREFTVWNHEYTNSNKIEEICDIIDLDYNKVKGVRYVSGTMFHSRTNLFLKYFNNKNLKIISNLLDNEIGDVKDIESGTYTHSLERIFGYIISAECMRIVDNSNI